MHVDTISFALRILEALRKAAIASLPTDACRVGVNGDGEYENVPISDIFTGTKHIHYMSDVDTEQWKQGTSHGCAV